MYRNPDEFAEYREYSGQVNEIEYADPAYYQQPVEPSLSSALPVEHPYSYGSDTISQGSDYAPYTMGQMQEYRGPQDIEGYTVDVGAQQRAAANGSPEEGKKRKKLTGLGGIAIAIGGFLAKFSFLLKFGIAGLSALLSVVVYSLAFGWVFAVGLVSLLFIHEMGHALVMKLKGIPVGGMIFIPMLGAVVTMKQWPQNAKDEAEVGIAGPIAGTIAASVCLYFAEMQPHSFTVWAPLAYTGFFLNLFNLIPIVPFDGGRVLAAIDRRVWIVGFLALLAYQIWAWTQGNGSWFLLLFTFVAATQLWSRGLKPQADAVREYYKVAMGTRIVLTILYFGLAGVLFMGMTIAHSLMPIV